MRRFGVPAAVLSLTLGAAQVAAAGPSQASSSTRIAVEAAPALPHGATAATAPAAATRLSLDVQLNTGHQAELAAYAAAVGDRNSPYYHQYLTPREIASDFGASADQVAAVTAQLRSAGLTVGQVTSDGMFLPVSATVSQAEHAFGVSIAGYQSAGRKFYANTSSPTVSAAISGDVSRIVGLDDIAYAVPHYTATRKLATVSSSTVKAETATATSTTSVGTCNAINSYWNNYNSEYSTQLYEGSGYYTADQVANAYGIDSAVASGDNGSGVTVAVFELENYDPTGVSTIDSCYGHSNSVTEVKVDGGPTAAPNQYDNIGVESALDIENIANLAPGASIIDYAGPDNATDTDVLNVYETIFNQDKASVVSTSWGMCEPVTQSGDSALQGEENALFEQAAAQGQTVVAASGDSGSTDCYGYGSTSAVDAGLSVDDPASQPFVLGAGGTGMTGTGTFTQSVWNECYPTTAPADCGAGGGGVSNYWPAQPYQSGLSPAGYTAHCATASTTGCRSVPDVSALADPQDGYVIEETGTYNGGTGESFGIIGGTSGAAPVWAAIFALADSSAQCKADGGAGFVNPSLYAAGKAGTSGVFTDVTTGNNAVSEFGGNGGYSAAAGYDLASGWGTPDAAGVISTVCAGSVVAPASYYVNSANGPVRLLDTRKGIGATGPVAAHASVNLQITGQNGVPTGNVTAVVLNVTAVSPTANGVATAYPSGQAVPTSSNLNWKAGQTEPNLVVVPVGSNGKISIWNGSGGTVQFLADEAGYFTSDPGAANLSTYTAVGPVRAMDTRHGTGVPLAKIAAGQSVSLQVGGSTVGSVSIPSGVTAVAMNVTAVGSSSNSDLIVYPNEKSDGTAETLPTVSNLNFLAGQTAANMVIVPVGPDGKVDFRNGGTTGSLDAIADIAGYFGAGTGGAKYHAVGPVRVLDTRTGKGEALTAPATAGKAIPAQGTLNLPLPASYSAMVANLTVVSPTANGFLSAYPSTGSLPNVSNLNFLAGQTIPNLAIVPSGSGVKFYNAASSGTTQLIVDMAGYFSAH